MNVDLSPEAIYQIQSALRNRGDHLNHKPEWAETAGRFDALEELTRDARLGTNDNLTIYIVIRGNDGETRYDAYNSYVCAARSEDEARHLGFDLDGDQKPTVWLAETTSVTVVGTGVGPARIISTNSNFS